MEDLLPAVFWLISTWLICRWSCEIVGRVFPDDPRSAIVLHGSVLAIATVVLGLTLLGSFGILSWLPGLLLPPTLVFLIKKVAEARSRARRIPVLTHLHFNTIEWSWAVVVAGLIGHSIVNGAMRFPQEWDNLMYHYPFIDHWIQNASFAATETPRWSDPANSEVVGLWFALGFSGDFLVALNNIPIVIVWIAAVIQVAKEFGLKGRWPHLIALASISTSATLRQTMGASNDLMVAAFFFATVAYLLRFLRSGRSQDVWFFGCCLGLLVGVKFFAAGYGLLAGLAFASLCWRANGFLIAMFRSLQAIAISLIFGGYWYLRNLVLTGHLFYPQGSSDLARRIPHPDMSQTTLAWNKNSDVLGHAVDAVWDHCGPVHWVVLLALPSIIISMCWMIFSDRTLSRPKHRFSLLLFLVVGTFVLAINTPMLVEDQPGTLNHLKWGYTPVRYTLAFLSVSVLAATMIAVRLLSTMNKHVLGLVQFGYLAVTVFQIWHQLSNPQRRVIIDPTSTIVAAELTLGVFIFSYFSFRKSQLYGYALLFFVGGASSILVCLQSQSWHTSFASHYNSFYGTSFFTDPESNATRVLVVDDRSYAFFGSRRENYIVQPMSFEGIGQIEELMNKYELKIAITVVETYKKVNRYRPAWQRLESAPAFSLVATGKKLRVFQYQPK